MNARTGTEGGRLDEEGMAEVRNSKDEKKNREGEEFVDRTKELGLSILNGITEGDEQGEYTYIGGAGCSVIDYVITNEERGREIKRMSIAHRLESDHNAMEIEASTEKWEREKEGSQVETVTVWTGLERVLEEAEEATEWKKLKQKIERATKKRLRKKGKEKRNSWWDEDCRKKKAKDTRREEERGGCGTGDKGSGRGQVREEILGSGEEKKKEEESKRRQHQRRRDVDRTLQSTVGEEEEEENSIRGTEERGEDSGEDEQITEEEVRNAIRKMKKGKAPGVDGIQNKVWLYGEGQMIGELTKLLNDIWAGNAIPTEWKTGLITPLFKKGDNEDTKNYRGITLMDTGYKIYTEIIRGKMEKNIERSSVPKNWQQFLFGSHVFEIVNKKLLTILTAENVNLPKEELSKNDDSLDTIDSYCSAVDKENNLADDTKSAEDSKPNSPINEYTYRNKKILANSSSKQDKRSLNKKVKIWTKSPAKAKFLGTPLNIS
ncbi:hypothetical protein TSAR_005090 [Trichomalopsis sarcophagae]|uniref:Endonuclease/exonuclease/phosphatase domain-containing protein n=1 Tax=Trichomalopsis sarcophagae TaxID=543379 RepID=A0A232FM33_9HYME|nr:hypothetical protein TSAR_005090 [Trichomalopsis sarcophagae]